MVEEVEKLHAELHLDAFRELKILVNTEVHSSCGGAGTNPNSRGSHSSQLEAVDRKHIRIEISRRIRTAGAARLTGHTIRTLAASSATDSYTGGIGKAFDRDQGCDGRAARYGDNGAGLPSTQRASDEPV